MGTHIQRKRFDHAESAFDTANGFKELDPSIPGLVNVRAKVVQIEDEYWVYVTQEGDLVTGNEPLLPDYEVVLAAQ